MDQTARASAPPRRLSVARRVADRLTLGRIALIIFLVILAAYSARYGLPTKRIDQTAWILFGIVAAKLGQSWRVHVRAVVDWIPLVAALLAYDHTRGVADSLGMPIRVRELVTAERWFFGETLPTVWLQERLYDPDRIHWYDVLAGVVYMSHFIVPWALAAAFYMIARDRWWRYIRMVLLLSYTGLLTYIVLPAAPPWFASREGVVADDVHRIAARGWWEVISPYLQLDFAATWFTELQEAGVNQVAALPSLHAGFALLVTVALWPYVHSLLGRAALVAFPLAMCFALVYGGEHYVIDVLLGWAYVGAIVVGLRFWDLYWSSEGRSEERAEDRARPDSWSSSSELVAAEDAPSEGASTLEVDRPHQQPLPVKGAGEGGADASLMQRPPDGFEVISVGGVGDRLEQPMIGNRQLGDGGATVERPPEHQN